MHNPFRACLVLPDGHMVLWDYKHAPFLAAMNPLVAELRSGAAFIYSLTGEATDDAAAAFAAEVADVLAAHAGRNRRLAVDKIMLAGFRALAARGLAVEDGEPLTERARAVKGPDEIRAMRCALHACEAAMAEMRAAARPGLSEDEILGAPPRRQHPPRRRVDRDPPPRLRPAHQPLVPGMRPAHRAAGRDPRLRHRPRRPLRLLRRHLPHLVDRRRRPAPRHGRRPPPRLRADRRQHRAPPPRRQLRRAARPRLRPPRALPRPALLLRLPRRRPLRRVALHHLSRGPPARRLRGRARARHGPLRRKPRSAARAATSRSSSRSRCW